MDLKFDKAKMFYPFVMNYLAMHHGSLDLFSRYTYKRILDLKAKGADLGKVIKLSEADEKRILFVSQIYTENLSPTLQIGDMSLDSSGGGRIELSADELTEEYVGNHPVILESYAISTSMLLISAYELSPRITDITDELWNFFYHCRNACAHGGKFNIIHKGEKMFPAKWRGLEITLALNGTSLFSYNKTVGLLKPADPIHLLEDIEAKYL